MRRRMKCVCGERPHTQTRRRRRTRAAQRVEASTQPRVLSARCARTLTGHCALALASLNVRCMHCVSNAPRVHGIVVQYGLTLVTAFSALFFSFLSRGLYLQALPYLSGFCADFSSVFLRLTITSPCPTCVLVSDLDP